MNFSDFEKTISARKEYQAETKTLTEALVAAGARRSRVRQLQRDLGPAFSWRWFSELGVTPEFVFTPARGFGLHSFLTKGKTCPLVQGVSALPQPDSLYYVTLSVDEDAFALTHLLHPEVPHVYNSIGLYLYPIKHLFERLYDDVLPSEILEGNLRDD